MTQRLLPTSRCPAGDLLAEAAAAVRIAQEKLSQLNGIIYAASYGEVAASPSVQAEFALATASEAADLTALVQQADAYVRVPILTDFVKRCDQGD